MTDFRLTGCVKWFNSKAGYGFITVIDDSAQKGEDIFVHHSAVDVEDAQYRYLVQGEYVEFDLAKTESEAAKHQWQSKGVTGIRRGKLMCETRRDAKISAPAPVTAPVTVPEVESKPSRVPRQRKPPSEPKQPKEKKARAQKTRQPKQ